MSFEPRSPLPTTAKGSAATAGSTRIGQSAGSPTGVIPPYSIPVRPTASDIGRNDAFRTPSSRRTTPFTSARVVARTMHAATRSTPSRLPATTTQFADSSSRTSYAAQNSAVSAKDASIGATNTDEASEGEPDSAAFTGAASRSGRDSADSVSSRPILGVVTPRCYGPVFVALFPRLRVAAYVICEDGDGRVLLSRWIGYDGPKWSLAGGGLDPGEHPQQGALRELFEETGYVGELDTLVGVDVGHFTSEHHVPEGYDGVDVHAVRIVYRGHVAGGELTHEVGGTSDLAEWVPRDELPSLDAVPLVAVGLAMADGDGVRVAPVDPNPPIDDGVRVESRVAAYGRLPDGDTVGALVDHGGDPAEVVRAAFRQQRGGRTVAVGRPCDATTVIEPIDDGGSERAVRWTVRLDYDVT